MSRPLLITLCASSLAILMMAALDTFRANASLEGHREAKALDLSDESFMEKVNEIY